MSLSAHLEYPADFVARFWSKTDRSGECWLWKGGKTGAGYGVLTFQGSRRLAHRLAYALASGAIPAGMQVCHTCDVPACINPSHLWLGTLADNMRDMAEKGRAASGDRTGPRLHPECMRRGEQVFGAKLTEAQVKEIRARHAAGGISMYALAPQYGMTESGIRDIIHRRNWKHI